MQRAYSIYAYERESYLFHAPATITIHLNYIIYMYLHKRAHFQCAEWPKITKFAYMQHIRKREPISHRLARRCHMASNTQKSALFYSRF